MALAVIPAALLNLHAQALQGLKRIAESTLVGNIGIPLISLLGVVALAPRWGAVGVTWAYTLGTVLTLGLGDWRWRRALHGVGGVVPRFETAVLLQSSMPLFWVASFQLVISWASTVSLGLLASSADVAMFSAASRTALLITFVLMAVNSIAAPKFAALYQQGDLATLGEIARKSAKLMAVLASPVLAVFVLFPASVMSIFGSEFASGAKALSILAVGQFVNVVTGSVGWILIMCGYERLMRNIIALCAGFCVALNVLLVPRLGATGAAIATAVTLSVQMLIGAALVWHRLGVLTIPFGRRKPEIL
jgi:O-antigen/teichoic acid export membrane protein